MASAVFEGTSLVNMFVRGCWVNGIRRLIVSRRGDEEEFFEIRTEWSDRSVLYLHRSFADLGRLCKRLRDAFPEDRPELARAPLRQGLLAIKEAHDIETRLNEVEKLLETVISMPCKYSRSEVVLTFFERSPLDQVLKNDNVHKIQPSFQSPVKISEIMRSNGFCLANTETIVIDHSIPNGKDQLLDADSTEHLTLFGLRGGDEGTAGGGKFRMVLCTHCVSFPIPRNFHPSQTESAGIKPGFATSLHDHREPPVVSLPGVLANSCSLRTYTLQLPIPCCSPS
ncbi:PX domain-containing protein 1 isoform X1 [Phodopus roborovskii]|uniref:PX domain-containing protein 1 isoform X1 n=1 Tax=Phodopus roborovskii TaxID=109678 RepID=UPI0021E3BED5|nr:PX domain-containing protein 1 isoform X1 [Phodopus roborovskii]